MSLPHAVPEPLGRLQSFSIHDAYKWEQPTAAAGACKSVDISIWTRTPTAYNRQKTHDDCLYYTYIP